MDCTKYTVQDWSVSCCLLGRLQLNTSIRAATESILACNGVEPRREVGNTDCPFFDAPISEVTIDLVDARGTDYELVFGLACHNQYPAAVAVLPLPPTDITATLQ